MPIKLRCFKVYFTDRLYLYTEVELEMKLDTFGLDLPLLFKVKNDWRYASKNNFSFQAKHNLHFNKPVHGA